MYELRYYILQSRPGEIRLQPSWKLNPYGSLTVAGPHNLIETATIMSCGLVEVDMALSEEVYHCKGRL